MNIKRELMLGILILLISGIVTASVELNDSYLALDYGPNENITGWINLSVINELSTEKLKTNFGDEISILELAEKNGLDITCSPTNCKDAYQINEEVSDFYLQGGGINVLGLKIEGEIESIDLLEFKISSSTPDSCVNPLQLDLTEDGKINWYSTNKSSDFTCSKDYGCYNEFENTQEFNIVKKPYCEKIYLENQPHFEVGAWVKKGSKEWDEHLLKMRIYGLDGYAEKECYLPEPPEEGGEISCVMDFFVAKPQDYYVCILAEEQTDYKIKAESVNPCGFFDVFYGNYTHDYHIFAKGGRYGSVGEVIFNQNIFYDFNGGNLDSYLNAYVSHEFGGECSGECVIPVKFFSGISQNVNLDNVQLDYTIAGGSLTSDKFYNLTESPSKLSFDFQKIDLGKAGFKSPSGYGNHSLKIYFKDELLLERTINIIKKPIIEDIQPKVAQAQVEAEFSAKIFTPKNASITSYRWDFGDGSAVQTQENKAGHTYKEIGTYTLTLVIQDETGFTDEKSFKILVGSPENIANLTINQRREQLEQAKQELSKLESWQSNLIIPLLNESDIDSKLKSLERKYLSATSQEDYVKIMSELNEIQVPESIIFGKTSRIPFVALFSNVNPEILKELGAGSYKPGNYDESVKAWFIENADAVMNAQTLFFNYDNEPQPMITFFKLFVNPKQKISESYLVINEQDLHFKENYGQKKIDGVTAIIFTDLVNKNLEFGIYGYTPLNEIEAYLSPEFNELIDPISPCNFNGVCEKSLGETTKNCRSDCKPMGRTIFFLLLVLISGFAAYIFLQEWYKKNYEKKLFSNKKELAKLLNFIGREFESGKKEEEIIEKLKKTGWNSEQISFAMKKYKGERTGMWEIPIFKFWEKKKAKKDADKVPPQKYAPKSPFKDVLEKAEKKTRFNQTEQKPEKTKTEENYQNKTLGFKSSFKPLKKFKDEEES